MEKYNVAQTLADTASRLPFHPALVLPAGRDSSGRAKFTQYTFQQINELSDRYAHGLAEYGFRQGDRTLMMIRPNADFMAVTFALFKIGAVPIFIDPGLGRKALLQCIAESEPQAMIGIPLAHVLRRLFPKPFQTIKRLVTAGRRWLWAGTKLEKLRSPLREAFPAAPTTFEDEGAIVFTSGSTGVPKGVIYTHGIFKAQIDCMRQGLHIEEGEIHLACLPAFALFNPALGVTTIMPDMNPAKTAQLNPAFLVEAIQTHGITISLGSPTVWQKVGDYCQANNIHLPSIKHIFMFGAPVYPELVEQYAALLHGGKIYTPFGATEALPLTLIDEQEILQETRAMTEKGAGVCVGHPLDGITIRIITIKNEVINKWDEALVLPPYQIGEIVVKGPVVTEGYLHRPEQTQIAKIYDKKGFWHRMGDLGYSDEQGRVWVCGRKSHRVETEHDLLLPIQCEAIFNQHPAISRSALVGVGEYGFQKPVLVVETKTTKGPKSSEDEQLLTQELLTLGAKYDHTHQIQTILFHHGFPVDVRHQAKIQREKLAVWAKLCLADEKTEQ